MPSGHRPVHASSVGFPRPRFPPRLVPWENRVANRTNAYGDLPSGPAPPPSGTSRDACGGVTAMETVLHLVVGRRKPPRRPPRPSRDHRSPRRGGMGEVDLAREAARPRDAAVKILPEKVASDPEGNPSALDEVVASGAFTQGGPIQ